MTIYDLLRLLVDDASNISDKVDAHELIRDLESTAALGTVASTISVGGAGHVCIPQREWENELCQRYIRRCALCRKALSDPWFPTTAEKNGWR